MRRTRSRSLSRSLILATKMPRHFRRMKVAARVSFFGSIWFMLSDGGTIKQPMSRLNCLITICARVDVILQYRSYNHWQLRQKETCVTLRYGLGVRRQCFRIIRGRQGARAGPANDSLQKKSKQELSPQDESIPVS